MLFILVDSKQTFYAACGAAADFVCVRRPRDRFVKLAHWTRVFDMKSMLLRQLIAVPLLLGSLAALHACGPASAFNRAGASPAPAQRFSNTYIFKVGGSIALAPAVAAGARAPSLKLERVNDSRCRTGVVCVWAGYISYSFTLTQPDGSASSFVLSENMPGAASKVSHNGLTFTLAGVEPQAVPAKNETTPDYRVSLRVSNTE
jgi:hypothetical protein